MLEAMGYPPGAIDGSYDSDTEIAVESFQMDWNSLMKWVWEYNPNITSKTPKYGLINVDGKYGPTTEKRLLRASAQFQDPNGSFVIIGEIEYPVSDFRDMVLTVYEHSPEMENS